MFYHFVLFVHVFGAAIIFMAIGILHTAMISMLRAKETKEIWLWANLAVKLDILFPAGTLLTLASAIYLMFSSWGWGYAWINVSLAALLGNSVLGMIFNLFHLKEISETAKNSGEAVPSAALLRKVRDRKFWFAISAMTMVTVGILFLMVMKLETIGSLMTMTFAVAAGFLLSNSLVGGLAGAAAQEKVPTHRK